MSRLRTANDDGLTLIELLVTMILLAVVSTLVVGAVSQAVRVLGQTEDEATGLNDAKTVLDRLGRDVREARGVDCDGGLADPTEPSSSDPLCQAHLRLWIDANSDYVKQDAELVTWRLEKNDDGEHYDVWRIVGDELGGGPVTRHVQASSLIVSIAFLYAPSPASLAAFDGVDEVRINMKYDAIVGRGTELRTAVFAARLRNQG